MRRRTCLVGVGAALSGALGFALANTEAAALAATTVDGASRASGEPTTAERTVEEDGLEHLPDSHEVRYVTSYSGGEPAGTRTEPFERWGARRAASVAAEVVLPVLRRRLDSQADGVGRGVRDVAFGEVVTVDHVTTLARDGSVESRPSVPFERLVETAPRSVETTVRLGEATHTRSVPVVVTRTEQHADPTLSELVAG